MAVNIDELGPLTPLGLDCKLVGAFAGASDLGRFTIAELLELVRPGFVRGGKLIGANFNTTADQAITIVSPTTHYAIFRHYVLNPSVALTTAQGGLYLGPGKSVAINGATTAYTTAQTAAVDTLNNAAGIAVANNVVTDNTTIYFSLTTPQGAAATGDVYVYIIPFWP